MENIRKYSTIYMMVWMQNQRDKMASYVPETICSPTKPSRMGNVDAFSANGYLKSSAGICYGYQKDNDMSSQELDRLLMGMDLNDQHIHLFREKAIDMDTFLILTEEDLIEIGIEDPDVRENILNGINNLNFKKATKQNKKFGVLDATKIMLSSTNHLDTLYNLLTYVQLRLRDQPVINQFLYDQYSASEGAEEMTKLLLQRVERLHDELQGLQDDINQETNKPKLSKRLAQYKNNGGFFKLTLCLLVSTTLITLVVWKKKIPYLEKWKIV